jgi:hypothetical protein
VTKKLYSSSWLFSLSLLLSVRPLFYVVVVVDVDVCTEVVVVVVEEEVVVDYAVVVVH